MTVLRTGLKCGIAIILLVMAADASPDQGQDADLKQDEIKYIKKYAWPEKPKPNENELLFSQRAPVARSPEPITKTANPSTPPPPAPPPPEDDHE